MCQGAASAGAERTGMGKAMEMGTPQTIDCRQEEAHRRDCVWEAQGFGVGVVVSLCQSLGLDHLAS